MCGKADPDLLMGGYDRKAVTKRPGEVGSAGFALCPGGVDGSRCLGLGGGHRKVARQQPRKAAPSTQSIRGDWFRCVQRANRGS